MSIKLVEVEEMRKGRVGSRKATPGQKYSKYAVALEPHIKFFKDEIAKSKDGSIRVKTDDIIKIIGSGVGKHPTSIYWAMKYTLFQEGLWVSQGRHKDGYEVIVMRMAQNDEKLPPSLTKNSISEGKVIKEEDKEKEEEDTKEEEEDIKEEEEYKEEDEDKEKDEDT